jgi:biotin carboxyl carrier protein
MSNARPPTEGNGDRTGSLDAPAARRRRTPWPLAVVAVLFVVVPFLTWYWTWFGRSLSDEEIEKYLVEGKPRHAQHALSQVAERIERKDAGAGRWNAQVVGLASSPSPDVRMTAAWVMGVEHSSQEFRETLVRLLEDPEPIVRRNAALALVRFGDARCRPELLSMLRPYAITARSEGTALTALTAGSHVKRESLLVRYKIKPNMVEEIRSPLPGVIEKALIKEGDNWIVGAELFVIAPEAEQVTDALTGLLYLGQEEELAEVERYARGVEGMPQDVKTKAALTAEAIKRRSAQSR